MTLEEFCARQRSMVRRARCSGGSGGSGLARSFRRLDLVRFDAGLHAGIHRDAGRLLKGHVVHRLGVFRGEPV